MAEAADFANVLENLSRIERKLDGLQLSTKIDRIEEILLKLPSGAAPLEVKPPIPPERKILASESTTTSPELPTFRPIPSILKKGKVRSDDEVEELVPIPVGHMPETLSVVPRGRQSLRSMGSSPGLGWQPERRSSVMSQRSSGGDGVRRNPGTAVNFEDPVSVDDLSLKMTRKLLRGFSACSNNFSLDDDKTSPRQSGKEFVLGKKSHLSLDELRANHNALVTAQSVRSLPTVDDDTGMPCAAELLMVFTGILEPWSFRAWQIWVAFLIVVFLGGMGFLAWCSGLGELDADIAFTSGCYMAGIVASIWMLRKGDIQELLKDEESSLDMYANQAGFVLEWKRRSRRRFLGALGCLILICSLRCLVYLQLAVSTHELIVTSSFCLASLGLVAVAYLMLHIFSGLELAIDSFAVNFFRDMDFDAALAEWNVLQAMLRHVSVKLSGALLMLGFASGSFILYLVVLGFVRSDIVGGFQFVLHHLWCLPPIMLFLYTMMRAAAVSEKASRVSPLVNSWTFDGADEWTAEWMDLKRQYMVQYINQSEAGFYMQGVRIRIFQVSKMLYYLGAVIFAVVSQMMI